MHSQNSQMCCLSSGRVSLKSRKSPTEADTHCYAMLVNNNVEATEIPYTENCNDFHFIEYYAVKKTKN